MSAPHTIIRASAGSGKTYQLSTRYLQLLFGGADPAGILASTFTRKAAGEILNRIFQRLAEACENEERAARLAQDLGFSKLTLAQVRAQLSRLVGNMDRIQVSTIDAFFARLASAFALDVGLPPRWRMMDASAVKAMRREAIRRMASEDRVRLLQLWRLLNQGGDERSLSAQLDELADEAHRLFVEGDEDAWCFLETEIEGAPPTTAELSALIDAIDLLPAPPHKSWNAAIAKDRDALLQRDFKLPLGKGLGEALLGGKENYYGKAIDGPHRELYERIVATARRGLLHRFAARNRSTYSLLEDFDHQFQRLKLERGSLYFDDLQRLLANLTQLGELEEIFFRLEARIQHILLDEFQDTSREQWRVLAPLVEELASEVDGRQSVFVVGDSKQAIYGWRGGEVEIFRSLDEQLHLPRESVQELSKSWRSSSAVLDAVNRVFATLGDNPVVVQYPETIARWREDFRTHESAFPRQPGQVFFHVADEAETDSAESRRASVRSKTVELLAELSQAHPGVEIGALLRRNEELARLRAALAERGVDASEEGGVSLARQPAVALLLSLLRVAEHPGDRVALFHLASSPLRGALGLGLPPHADEGLQLSAKTRRRLHREGLRACLLEYALMLYPHCAAPSRARLRRLVSAAQSFERDESQRVADFLLWIEDGSAGDPSAAPIRLMTVHGAKGLQFPIVVLCDLEASSAQMKHDAFMVGRRDPRGAPDRITRHPAELLRKLSPALAELSRQSDELKKSEQLSVLYVAMTRASHALHLVGAAPQPGRPNDSHAALLRSAFFGGAEPEAGSRTLLAGDATIEIDLDRPEEPSARPMRVPQLAKSAAAKRSAQEAPSAHEAARVRSASALLRLSDPTARLRGVALHRCFEAVTFSEAEPDSDATILRGLHRELPGRPETALRGHLREFHELRRHPAIHEALSRAHYAKSWGDELRLEIWRERAFALRDGNAIVRGRFDRVVLGCDDGGYVRAHVLDYKSDRVDPRDPDEVERLRAFYEPQLAVYRRAVSRRCRLSEDVIECSLLFLTASLHLRL
jgi:ATP-dependent exoDNAse (exonuclease V) beta subunit